MEQELQKKILNNIFERFYRSDVSRNSIKGGSGLGLAIAKKIIEDHGGKIWAESKECVGTSIFFTLKKSMEEESARIQIQLQKNAKLYRF